METEIRDKFSTLWSQYFNDAELPITFYYTDEEGHAAMVAPGSVPRCLIGALTGVREGNPLCFSAESIGCPGGRRYLGFAAGLMPNFEYFLSYGIPGKLEGERYSKSPEHVREIMKHHPDFTAPARFVVFKRWDRLEAADSPEVVIFFAQPDVLSGLFTLARYAETEPDAIRTPFGAGCSTIVTHPYREKEAAHPRAIIGLFDVSARPFVPPDALSFAVPMNKFAGMVADMEESFLITNSWKKVQQRIG